jgi:hypothetical protein
MIIVQLNGGLGNQLFQYAAAKSLSLHSNTNLKLDVSSFYRENLPELEVPRDFELYNFQGVHEEIISSPVNLENEKQTSVNSKLQKLFPRHKRDIYIEPFYHYDRNFFKANTDVILKGQWQSEKYFLNFSDSIKSTFRLKENLVSNVIQFLPKEKETVSVHVRRGDYMRKQIILEWHGVMPKSYYEKAFELLTKRISNIQVYYFSDDPEWVEKELIPIMPGIIISSNISRNHFEDFYLMSQCKHNIIANSSFSWWAAWLNPNPDNMVIAPKKWFNKGPQDTQDLFPPAWIKID